MEKHMKAQTTLLTALAATGLLLSSVPVAIADTWNKETHLRVNETIEVPGAVLEPGEYVVKLVDSQSNRHIVRFLNEREDRVISTVLAIPNYRMEPTGDTEFTWYETRQGEPPALRAWFYPGDNFGQEFVYPKRQGSELTTRIGSEVPTMKPEQTAAINEQPTEAARGPAEESEPVLMAQAREPQRSETEPQRRESAPATEEQPAAQSDQPSPVNSGISDDESLPQTAGPAPLLALLGLISLGSAVALRKVRKG
jgi:hypothetical protein